MVSMHYRDEEHPVRTHVVLERIILHVPGNQYCYRPGKKEALFKTVMHAVVNHSLIYSICKADITVL